MPTSGSAGIWPIRWTGRWSSNAATWAPGHAASADRSRMPPAPRGTNFWNARADQAETFLLRLLRGAGARGLAGMHPRRGAIIRPLLACRRAELRAFLDSRQIAYVQDESNEDVSIPRNRVRVELLPFLERRFNPSIVDVLADEADLAPDRVRSGRLERRRQHSPQPRARRAVAVSRAPLQPFNR